MTYDRATHNRQSIRLKGYDYSQEGVYFVTINIKERNASHAKMGQIVGEKMALNDIGRIVSEVWQEIPAHFKDVELDSFIIMPDHVHGIIIIKECAEPIMHSVSTNFKNRGAVSEEHGLKRRSLGSIVGSFKAEVSRRVNRIHKMEGVSFWQRNYYERIIRSEYELETVRNYIDNNPANWKKDG